MACYRERRSITIQNSLHTNALEGKHSDGQVLCDSNDVLQKNYREIAYGV